MTAHTRLDPPLVESIRKALTGHALPGETHGLTREAEREAAEFLAQVASRRKPGEVEIAVQSTGGSSTTTCRSWSIRSQMRSPGARSPSTGCSIRSFA